MPGQGGGFQKLLLVDDDTALQRLFRILGKEIGVEVVSAANGREALEQIDHERPDIIVLDLVMPVMDGRSFYAELRARNIDTPVLILSAYDAHRAQRELRAQASLEKPFEIEELVTVISSLAR